MKRIRGWLRLRAFRFWVIWDGLVGSFWNWRAQRRGWRWEDEGWMYRLVREGDRHHREFDRSCNAFIGDERDVLTSLEQPVGRYLVCRDGRQARVLDRGGMV